MVAESLQLLDQYFEIYKHCYTPYKEYNACNKIIEYAHIRH